MPSASLLTAHVWCYINYLPYYCCAAWRRFEFCYASRLCFSNCTLLGTNLEKLSILYRQVTLIGPRRFCRSCLADCHKMLVLRNLFPLSGSYQQWRCLCFISLRVYRCHRNLFIRCDRYLRRVLFLPNIWLQVILASVFLWTPLSCI